MSLPARRVKAGWRRSISFRGCLLDAGCGEGYYSIGLAASGFAVMGFDLSKYAVDAAARARAERLRKASRDGSHTPVRGRQCV